MDFTTYAVLYFAFFISALLGTMLVLKALYWWLRLEGKLPMEFAGPMAMAMFVGFLYAFYKIGYELNFFFVLAGVFLWEVLPESITGLTACRYLKLRRIEAGDPDC